MLKVLFILLSIVVIVRGTFIVAERVRSYYSRKLILKRLRDIKEERW